MIFRPLLVGLAGFLANPANSLTLTDTQSGDAAPATVFASTTTDGDLRIVSALPGAAPSTLGDATNERTFWTHDVSGLYSGTFTTIQSAVIDLTWRAGGDNRANDNLYLSGQVVASLAGTVTGNVYSASFDVLAARSEAVILAILNRSTGAGLFEFQTADDSAAVTATLRITGTLAAVPLPGALPCLTGAAALLCASRRRVTHR